MANNIDKEYEDYLKQQNIDAEYEAYKAQQTPVEKKDYLAETVMSPEFQQPGVPSEETFAKGLVGAANVADVIGSSARAGISEAVKGYNPFEFPTTMEELKAGPEAVGRFAKGAGEQLVKNIRSPLTAPMEAPSMGEIIGRELRTRTIPNVLLPESVKRQGETLGGVFSELAMPAFEISAAAKGIKAIPKAKETLDSFLKGSKQALLNTERKQMGKVMAAHTTKAQYTNSNINPNEVALSLVDEDLTKLSKDPKKLKEELEGVETYKSVEKAPGMFKHERVYTPGLIARKSEAMRKELFDAANAAGVNVKIPDFVEAHKARKAAELQNPLSGQRYSPEIIQRRNQIIDEYVKPYEEEWVPGVPLESLGDNPRLDVPPPFMQQADQFPARWQGQYERAVKAPEFPPKPEFEGINIPEPLKAPEDINRMAGVPTTPSRFNVIRKTEAKPVPPSSYGGVISDKAQVAYEKDLKEWAKKDALAEKQYQAELKAADKADKEMMGGAEKIRQSLAQEANTKYDDIKKAWEQEKAKVQEKYDRELSTARGLDQKMMDSYIQHSADRFIEKAKKNELYKKEIMDKDLQFRDKLIDSINSKVFNAPRYSTIEDLMKLRSEIGKKLASKDFATNANLSTEKEVLTALYNDLRDEISKNLTGVKTKVPNGMGGYMDAAEYYDISSENIHRLMQGAEVLKGAELQGMKSPDTLAKFLAAVTAGGIMGGTGVLSHMAGGSTSIPAAALGLWGAKEAYQAVEKGTPQMIARGASAARKGIEAAEKSPEALARILSTGSRQARDNYIMENKSKFPKVFGREPQSLNIEDVKIPRSIQGILSNKEMVLEKLASTGMSDNLYRSIAYGLNKSPKNLPNVIPLLMTEYPDIFEDDPSSYNLLDGKFIDSNEAAKAADETSKRSDLNSVQKAKIINEINKNKKWIGDK